MCGENTSAKSSFCVCVGSPPRVRGKLVGASLHKRGARITPACAGKTRQKSLLGRAMPDHPRVCGENLFIALPPCVSGGSPPRVRGKQSPRLPHGSRGRITPACAGKTLAGIDIEICGSDHPRVCGENGPQPFLGTLCFGSPPRVRGKRPWRYPLPSPPRITPACAGKTERYTLDDGLLADHPRVCGENRSVKRFFIVNSGSPPRVRGKLAAGVCVRVELRITPACAGKTHTKGVIS